jgi:hypothetical protein
MASQSREDDEDSAEPTIAVSVIEESKEMAFPVTKSLSTIAHR